MLQQFLALQSDVKQHLAGTLGSASDDKPFHNSGEVALYETRKGLGRTVRSMFHRVDLNVPQVVAYLSGLLSCARITVLGLNNGLMDQQYPHCDKDVAETALIGDCGHIYAHGSWVGLCRYG